MKGELGFTGTRNDPSKQQKAWLLAHMLESVVDKKEITRVHHGCCVGSDEFFHRICKTLVDEQPETGGFAAQNIVLHPPADRSREMEIDEWTIQNCLWYPRKPYLLRNLDIVHTSSRLVALPDRLETTRGSGTWYTIHRAMESNRHVTICWPDGTVEPRFPKTATQRAKTSTMKSED